MSENGEIYTADKNFTLLQISHSSSTNIIFSFKTFLLLLLRILGSMFNLFDLSRTMCSFFLGEPASRASPHQNLLRPGEACGRRPCCLQYLSLFFPFVFIFHFSLVFPVVIRMRIMLLIAIFISLILRIMMLQYSFFLCLS